MSALPHQPHDPTPKAPPRPSRTPTPLKNLIFNPPDDHIDRILDRILDPQFALTTIAFDYETTLPALNLWLARPDIDERLRALESICSRRTRLIAANALPFTVTTLTRVLEEYNEDEYLNPGDTNSRENKRRWHETARKTSHLLFRIATYDPARPRPAQRSPRAQHPAPAPFPYYTTTTTTTDPTIIFSSAPTTPSVLSAPSLLSDSPNSAPAPTHPITTTSATTPTPAIPASSSATATASPSAAVAASNSASASNLKFG